MSLSTWLRRRQIERAEHAAERARLEAVIADLRSRQSDLELKALQARQEVERAKAVFVSLRARIERMAAQITELQHTRE
jgi:chromosome segregation ATPase